MDDYNPSGVSNELELGSVEAENASSGNDVLSQINASTGRNYKTLEEATQGIKETYSFVGQVGQLKEKAQRYDEISAKSKASGKDDEFYARVDKMEFLYSHPELREYDKIVDDIRAIANVKGVSMQEAYANSPYKNFVEKEKQAQEASSATSSRNRLVPGQTGFSPEDFNRLPLEGQRKIVERLSIYNNIPKAVYQSSKRTG